MQQLRVVRFSWVAAALAVALAGCDLVPGGNATAPAREQAGAGKEKSGGRAPKAHLVSLATVGRETLSLSRVYTGSLRVRRVLRVYAQEEGRITSLPFFEGDAVAKDQVILRLERTLLETELRKAAAVRREAEANLARLQRLAKSRLVAEDELLRGRTALDVARAEEALFETRLGYTVVTAPFAGVVSERRAEPGDIVERHGHVLTIVDPSTLIADLQVSELILPHLAVGTPVRVRIDALGDDEHPGRVQRIHPTLDPLTRQGRIEVELSPPPPGARAGQFARVAFDVRALDRLVVPFSALRRDTEGEYVFRMVGGDRVERVRVRGGRRLADLVEVLEGLSPGDRIVTRGFLGLTADLTVKPVGGGRAADGDKRAKGSG